MKKIGTLILSIAIAATMIAGCGNKLTTSDTAPSSSETAATTEATTEAAKPQSFDDIYGPQLKAYMDREYYFDGKKISKQEANFYFINSFRDLSSYAAMGYYPKTADGHINLSAECNGDDYKTYGEYFIMYSEKTLQSTCILVSRAEQSGVTLDEDMKKSIDDMMEDIRTNSAPQYGKTVDEYLQMNYGPLWNVSAVAMLAGEAALSCKDWITRTREYVQLEKKYIMANIPGVIDSCANFMLIKSREDVADKLYEQGIAVRKCHNFSGLDASYIRIGVKNHECNEAFVNAYKEIING